MKDLDEEGHCAGELMEQIWAVATDYPDIAMLLERISKEKKKHRDEIREMLMRSDAFADRSPSNDPSFFYPPAMSRLVRSGLFNGYGLPWHRPHLAPSRLHILPYFRAAASNRIAIAA